VRRGGAGGKPDLKHLLMNDRTHAYLDGELPREALTPHELSEALAFQDAVGGRLAALRDVPVPDLTARIMAQLPATPVEVREPVWTRFAAWLWRPRTLSLQYRPAYLAAGLAFAGMATVVVPASVQNQAVAPDMYVQFRIEVPAASDVRLAGSFTGWRPELALHEVAPGVWTTLVPLQPGVHDYTFLVDGERWVVDPYATNVEDSFGGSNSRLFLPTPRESA
jgi:hypothetical protein